jgi:hypothetical protein
MLAFLGTKIAKVGAAIGALGLILFLTFQWGFSSAKGQYARKAAQEAAEWAERVRGAEAQAYAKGLQAARVEIENRERLDEIARAAEGEAGSEDLCLSEDIVDRIRAIQ